MSGDRYLLDTNAVVALLRGDPDVLRLASNASWLGISIITQLEFLAFDGLSEDDRSFFEEFRRRVSVVGLESDDSKLIELVVALRKQSRVKLPDAIIAASAMRCEASLLTADREFEKISGLDHVGFGQHQH